jgi:hypothetical protein
MVITSIMSVVVFMGSAFSFWGMEESRERGQPERQFA